MEIPCMGIKKLSKEQIKVAHCLPTTNYRQVLTTLLKGKEESEVIVKANQENYWKLRMILFCFVFPSQLQTLQAAALLPQVPFARVRLSLTGRV